MYIRRMNDDPPAQKGNESIRKTIEARFVQGSGKQPRPHQTECVIRLLDSIQAPSNDERSEGNSASSPTENFLIQASVGAGKSLIIASLVRELLEPGPTNLAAILVVNDRIQLDLQLSATTTAFLLDSGIPSHRIERAASVDALARILSGVAAGPADREGPPVVFSTLQKVAALFRRNVREGKAMAGLAGGERVIVIADEAHRSHSKNSADHFHTLLGGTNDAAAAAAGKKRGREAKIEPPSSSAAAAAPAGATTMQSVRTQPRGVTYVAFTATPSESALTLFGVKESYLDRADEPEGEEGEGAGPGPGSSSLAPGPAAALAQSSYVYRPFFAFTMEQAIQSGVILDPLRNYTLVSTHLKILQASVGKLKNGGGSGTSAARAVNESLVIDAAASSREVVEHKCEFIVQKLREIMPRVGVRGARVMVVVRSRAHVVWFTEGLRRRIGQILRERAQTPSPGEAAWPTDDSIVFETFSGQVAVAAPAAADAEAAAAAAAESEREAAGRRRRDPIPTPTVGPRATSGAPSKTSSQTPIRRVASLDPLTAGRCSPSGRVESEGGGASRSIEPEGGPGLEDERARSPSESGGNSESSGGSDSDSDSDSDCDPESEEMRPVEEDEEDAQITERIDTREDTAGSGRDATAADAALSYLLNEDDLNRPCNAVLGNAEILVLCGKLETGYDEPRLTVAFIDRPLTGARAVQVLGRLIRPAPDLGKSSDAIAVFDFVNSAGQVRDAFLDFYDVSKLYVGPHALRRRRLIELERCMLRMLEALEPAARLVSPAGGLGALSSLRCAELIRSHPPHVRAALEADLAAYLRLSALTAVECAEMPCVYAQGVDRGLRRIRKEAAAAATAAAAAEEGPMHGSVCKGEDGADAEDWEGSGRSIDVQLESVVLQETFRGSLSLARDSASAQATTNGGAGVLQDRTGIAGASGSGGRGANAISPARAAAPLFRPRTALTRAASAADVATGPRGGTGGGGRSVRGGGGDTTFRSLMKKDPPLAELIRAANRSLSDQFAQQVDAYLRQAAAGLLAYAHAMGAGGGDPQYVLDQLRRLELQPITADRLKSSGLGTAVNALRKCPHEMIAGTARRLVQRWKDAVTQEMRQASKAAQDPKTSRERAAGAASAKPDAAISKSVIDAAAITNLRARLRAALLAAMAGGGPGPGASQEDMSEMTREIGEQLEERVFASCGGHAASSVDGLKEYQSRVRVLLLALRETGSGCVRERLIGGSISVEEVATTRDDLVLASDEARRRHAEEMARKEQKRAEWRALMDSMTFVECVKCHEMKAVSYTTTTGGTYAQDKEPIVYYTCTLCDHNWC